MTSILTMISWFFLLAGGFFFVAGTAGLVRFPDVYSRLHAVTKADTLGLGLIIIGLSFRADSLQSVAVMILIWLLVLASSATACQILARHERERTAHKPTPHAGPKGGAE